MSSKYETQNPNVVIGYAFATSRIDQAQATIDLLIQGLEGEKELSLLQAALGGEHYTGIYALYGAVEHLKAARESLGSATEEGLSQCLAQIGYARAVIDLIIQLLDDENANKQVHAAVGGELYTGLNTLYAVMSHLAAARDMLDDDHNCPSPTIEGSHT